MNNPDLSQSEIDHFIRMEKHRKTDIQYKFPILGGKLMIPLLSPDKKESFMLDVTRSYTVIRKETYQNRAHLVYILVRLDLNGPRHVNPDGVILECPHLHVHKEGYADRWAYPVPDIFSDLDNLSKTLDHFMAYCNITKPPNIERVLI